MPRPRLTTQYVADSFGWNAVAKARVLCKQGDVLEWSFNIDGTKVMGGVRDSQRAQPYRVALNLYDSRDSDEAFISGQCSCHAERGCLHGVALALTLLEAAGQGEEYAVPVALADLPESESGAEAGYPEKDSDLEPGAAVALSSSQTADIVATVSAAADSGTVQSAVLAPSLASKASKRPKAWPW